MVFGGKKNFLALFGTVMYFAGHRYVNQKNIINTITNGGAITNSNVSSSIDTNKSLNDFSHISRNDSNFMDKMADAFVKNHFNDSWTHTRNSNHDHIFRVFCENNNRNNKYDYTFTDKTWVLLGAFMAKGYTVTKLVHEEITFGSGDHHHPNDGRCPNETTLSNPSIKYDLIYSYYTFEEMNKATETYHPNPNPTVHTSYTYSENGWGIAEKYSFMRIKYTETGNIIIYMSYDYRSDKAHTGSMTFYLEPEN